MGSAFDIFKVTSDGPLWVEAVHGFEEAKERMNRLALTFGRILHSLTGTRRRGQTKPRIFGRNIMTQI